MSKRFFLLLCTILISNLSLAQQKEVREDMVDSLTFAEKRQQLNNLNTDKFLKKEFKMRNTTIPYRLLTPKASAKKTKYPLVLTFHNSSRIGNDNEKQLEHLARIWLQETIYTNYPCYVVAPQFSKRSSNYEKNADHVLFSTPSDEVGALLDLVKNLEKIYPDIDTTRIYLIGYSMGASTAQNLLNRAPDKFAAMVSIAAVPDFSNLKNIQNKNIWLIHGEQDEDNPYNGSVELYRKLNTNKNLIFTTFSHLNHHNIVIPFLTTDEIPKWLFDKRD